MLVFPLLIIAILWLAGKLVKNENTQVAIKLVAWMFALGMAIGVIGLWLVGSVFSVYIIDPALLEFINLGLMFVANPVFIYGIVVPRYKEVYPNSSFLQSKIWLLVVYFLFFLFMLANTFIGGMK